MSAQAPPPTELHDLIEQVLEGRLTDQGRAQLNVLLAESAEARQRYLRHLMLHGNLAWGGSMPGGLPLTELARQVADDARQEVVATLAPQPAPLPTASPLSRLARFVNQPSIFSLICAASVLFAALTFLSMLMLPDRAAEQTAQSPADHVREGRLVLRAASDCEFAAGLPALAQVGQSARRVVLKQGVAEFAVAGGVRLVLSDRADFTARASNGGRLRLGTLAAEVPAGARGFTVETPLAKIVDLGTQFIVSVHEDGTSQVHVVEGTVEVRPRGSTTPPARLVAGQAARICRVGDGAIARLEPIECRAETFVSEVPSDPWKRTLLAERADTTVSDAKSTEPHFPELRIGGRRDTAAGRAAIIPFPLPQRRPGLRVTEASFAFSVASLDVSEPLDWSVDLYGLPARWRAEARAHTDFYVGPFGEAQNAWPIAQGVLTSDAQLRRYRISGAPLVEYLNAQLSAGRRFFFLRLNPDRAVGTNSAYQVASADHPDPQARPVLELRFAPLDPTPTPTHATPDSLLERTNAKAR